MWRIHAKPPTSIDAQKAEPDQFGDPCACAKMPLFSPCVRRVELRRRSEHTGQGLLKFRCVRALAIFTGLAEPRFHCSKNSVITRSSSREKKIPYECFKCKCLISLCFVLWYRQSWNFNFRIGNTVVQFQWCITAGILHMFHCFCTF